ncbi:MAG TPA: hypothetical protein VGX70_14660 [Gemmataceae bacterium]|jgi:hypothetical protein|nr:hypothetical protein [Gemmataceae bacterium]
MKTFRGIVKNQAIVLVEGAPVIPEGTEVLITPIDSTPGSPAAILAAMDSEPHVPSEWVDELEALIADGQRPPSMETPFDDPQGG